MIAAIETKYKGHRFRSRAEARWAVFFDTLGIKWMYEIEGLRLSDGTLYLPDFYLPKSKTWFEVKGVMSDADMHKIKQLQKDNGDNVAVGYADFTFQSSDNWAPHEHTIGHKADSLFVRCRDCGEYYFVGNIGSYMCPCCDYYNGDSTFEILLWGDGQKWHKDEKVEEALRKAKSARFEHGEGYR